jgi:hypothetical protein
MGTDGGARAREKQSQVIVNFGGRANRAARVFHAVLLLDGDGRLDVENLVHIRTRHFFNKLTRVGAHAFHEAPLSLGIKGVKREGGFATAGNPRDDR